MKNTLIFLFVLVVPVLAQAQKSKTTNPKGYASTIREEDLKKLLYILADKNMEGRETATPGQRKAAAYLEGEFKRLGLLPGMNQSYQQEYPVYRDSLTVAKMVVQGKELKLREDFQPGQSFTAVHQYFSEVTFAGYGIVDSAFNSYGNTSVRGKAVLMLSGGPSGFKSTKTGFQSPTFPFAKIAAAREKGAALVFMVMPLGGPTPGGNMYVNLFRESVGPNVIYITEATANILLSNRLDALKANAEKAQDATPVKTELEVELNKVIQKRTSSNVLGILEGTDKKNEYLIITAHYDHLGKRGENVYQGADDDGSGTVGVLEIAEAFVNAKKEGKGPRRSILFMLVSGEEKGLWGSRYYSEHPTIQPDWITANLNIDMIGRVDTERKSADTLNYVYVVGDDKISTELKPISEGANKQYSKLSLDYRFNDPADPNRIYFRSDHYNFARIGVPIIFYYDGMLKADYHKPTDTPDKINYTLLAKRARLVFFTAWEMANRETMVRRDLPVPTLD